MKLLVIGNSHTGSLRRGYESVKDRFVDKISIRFAGTGNPFLSRWKLSGERVYHVYDFVSEPKPAFSIRDFDLIIVAAGYSITDPRLLYKSHIHLHSKAVLKEIVCSGEDPSFQFSNRAPIVKSFLNDHQCSKQMLLVGSPYPSSEVYQNFLDNVPRKSMPGSLRDLYTSFGSGLSDKLVRVHNRNRRTVENICEQLLKENSRIKYYVLPDFLLDETRMFTKKELMKPDRLHGNDDYGRLVMLDICNKLLK